MILYRAPGQCTRINGVETRNRVIAWDVAMETVRRGVQDTIFSSIYNGHAHLPNFSLPNETSLPLLTS